jgi:peptidoglycan/xylan/chitin deacetylase (PgdA/CDA1 family)
LPDDQPLRRTTPSRRTLLTMLALAGCGASATKKATSSPAVSPSQRPSARPAQPAPAPSTAAPQGPAVEVVHGSRSRNQVALTFHGSGDPALAEALLQAAEARSALITVFAVGNWLAANPSIGRRILAGGHELANHTYTHPNLGSLSEPAVEEEFTRARDVIQQVSGNNGRYARPSAMDRSTPLVRTAAGRVGYRTVVAFDVDPADYRDPGAAAVISRTLAGVQRGSIVSLHLGHPGTVTALPAILDGLAARGLRPVTVRTLLA